jgi:hypothetical protein
VSDAQCFFLFDFRLVIIIIIIIQIAPMKYKICDPTPARRKVYDHTIYKKITHIERLNVIYGRVIHKLSLNQLSLEQNIKYNTVRNILNAYNNSGRTNKKKYLRKGTNTEREP